MTIFQETELAIAAFGMLGVGIIGKRAGWFKIIGGTNALLREQNQELRNSNELKDKQISELTAQHEQDMKDFAASHLESQRAISKLEGQVNVLSTLQLNNIADTLNEMKELLKNSAVTLAQDTAATAKAVENKRLIDEEDRDVLTNQNKHIETEVGKILDADNKRINDQPVGI